MDTLDELAPDFALSAALRSSVLSKRGEFAAADAALDSFRRLTNDSTVFGLAATAVVDARSGRRDDALAVVEMLRDASYPRYVHPALIARVLIALGEYDAALDELARAKSERSLPILVLASDPDFEPLRGDARFAALLEGLGGR